MKNGIVIADAGPIFSLAVLQKLELLDALFNEIKIPSAVWEEITLNENTPTYKPFFNYFKNKVFKINGLNDLNLIMDYGESEAVTLYREVNADFLLLDDKKARKIAENFGLKCIGTIGLLVAAKSKQLIPELAPEFKKLIVNKRYYSVDLLNELLLQNNESPLTM